VAPPLLLQPLRIRGLRLAWRALQAPLAGYSDRAFRLMCWRYGRPGLLATEMISARAAVEGTRRQEEYMALHPEEGPVQFQLWGTEPDALAEAARICADRGAAAIDLNCGCPVRKVTASGAGVALMRDPPLLGRCVAALRRATDLPVSAKIRLGPEREGWNGAAVARLVEDAGADLLTVHGRHGRERYATPVRVEAVAAIAEAVSLPVIGNGDVRDAASAQALVRRAGVDGVMIGRGCMGDPWVFDRLRAELSGEAWEPPSLAERGRVLLENFRLLIMDMGEDRAVRHVRKLACYYSRGLPGARSFRLSLNRCGTAEAFEESVRTHFHGAAAPGSAGA
jgi:nifR3 family TIM-barrel protein